MEKYRSLSLRLHSEWVLTKRMWVSLFILKYAIHLKTTYRKLAGPVEMSQSQPIVLCCLMKMT